MYVRTNYRKEKVIRKIVHIVEDSLVHDHYLIFDKPTKYTYYVEDNNYIAKENLIELIKIGDYVNGYKVVDFSVTYFNGTDRRKQPKRIGLKVVKGKFDYENYIEIDDIKTIVTKEEFEDREYEVKEDE